MKTLLDNRTLVLFLIVISSFANLLLANKTDTVHIWELKEIKFNAENDYKNSYMDVTFWIDLKDQILKKEFMVFGMVVIIL